MLGARARWRPILAADQAFASCSVAARRVLERIIDEFFDAALTRRNLAGRARTSRGAFGAREADIHVLRNGSHWMSHAAGIAPRVVDEYIERFLYREPRSCALARFAPGQVGTDSDITDEQARREHAFYADFLPRNGLGAGIFAAPLRDGANHAYLGINFAAGCEPPSLAQRPPRGIFTPPSRGRSAQLRLAGLADSRDLYAASLDALTSGVIYLGEARRIRMFNPAARRLLDDREVLRVENNRLRLLDSKADARFGELFRAAKQRLNGSGGSMLLGQDGLRPRYSVHVNPLPTELQDRAGACVVLLIMQLSREGQRHRARELRDLFALTQAEARLAECLLQGYSLQDRGEPPVSPTSARFTLRQVYAKVGVHKQSELVALLAAAVAGWFSDFRRVTRAGNRIAESPPSYYGPPSAPNLTTTLHLRDADPVAFWHLVTSNYVESETCGSMRTRRTAAGAALRPPVTSATDRVVGTMKLMDDLQLLAHDYLDAALEPAGWPAVLDRTAGQLGAVGMDPHLLRHGASWASYMGGQPAEVLAEYTERFINREPRSLVLQHLRPGQVVTDLDFVDRETMRTHEYYADFLRRADMGHCLAATPWRSGGNQVYLGVHFPYGREPPDAERLAVVRALQPYLARAVGPVPSCRGRTPLHALQRGARSGGHGRGRAGCRPPHRARERTGAQRTRRYALFPCAQLASNPPTPRRRRTRAPVPGRGGTPCGGRRCDADQGRLRVPAYSVLVHPASLELRECTGAAAFVFLSVLAETAPWTP